MELGPETEDYIRKSIDHTVGLPVSNDDLLHKIHAVEESNTVLRHQYLSLHSKLKEKDEIIERSRAEASMNAVALRKFVEENQKLATECSNLLETCKKWESECALYDLDREALMDFANDADGKAKESETRCSELEEENKKLLEDLKIHKLQSDGRMVNASTEDFLAEQILLDSLLSTMYGDDEISIGQRFLESQGEVETCGKLVKMWSSLRPSTQKVVALAADVKTLEKDKDYLRTNLHRAEEEVKVLFEENNILNEENKRLMRQCYSGKRTSGSGGGSISASGKGKRKSTLNTSSPMEKKIDFGDVDSQRHPLSPLQCNSPESRMRKK